MRPNGIRRRRGAVVPKEWKKPKATEGERRKAA